MAGIENIDFQEISGLPITEDKADMLVVGYRNIAGNPTMVTPIGNLATKAEVESAVAGRATTQQLNTATSQINQSIVGLSSQVASKADQKDVDALINNTRNMQAGILFQDRNVATPNLLPIPPATFPDGKEALDLWGVFVESEGCYYQYSEVSKEWNKTIFKEMPDNIATIDYADAIVTNPYSKYEITSDQNGWVFGYELVENPYIIENSSTYLDLNIVTDRNGFVLSGTDWDNKQLFRKNIESYTPNIYNIESDYNGNVLSYLKTWGGNSRNAPDKISGCLTGETTIIKGATHYGFPSICSSKKGVLHSFFRQGSHHASTDGSILYSYSKDYGATWYAPVIFLQGGNESVSEGYTDDYRDSKIIRMSNGKFLYSTFMMPAKEKEGIPPNNIEYDYSSREAYVFIIDELSDGILDIANATKIVLPTISEPYSALSAGGIVEHNRIIYHTLYGGTPHNCYLIKSEDFGLTWSLVSKIQDGYNENSIAFINDTMFCIMRSSVSNASYAKIVKSDDFGLTWEVVRELDTYYHGMYALSLGDTIMIAGRAYDERTSIFFMDKYGDFILNRIATGATGDSSYAQICTLENYVHIIYYSQLSTTNWGVFTRKIERSKVIGLSY